jgi:hypothetical protein
MPTRSHRPCQKTDKRLLGTWKSDARRTFADWNWKKNTSPKRKARLKSFFGKLEITYTCTKVISKLRYRRWEQARRYAVIGMDEEIVAIVLFGKLEIRNREKYDSSNLELVDQFNREDKIEHIHFDKNHFWISFGNGKNREFFRRASGGR